MTDPTAEEQEFVERSIALMLGNNPAGFSQGDAAMLRALQGSSASAIAVLPQEGPRYALAGNGARVKPARPETMSPRSIAASENIGGFRPHFGYVVDMWDRRIRSTSDGTDPPFPVFSFNRIAGEPGRVLWPLAKFHDAGSRDFLGHLDPDCIGWEDKLPKVVWRGGTGGRAIGSSAGRGEGMRLISALRRYQAGTLGRRKLERVIRGTHRWHVLDRIKDDPRFDLGFVDSADYVIAETPLHQHLERPRLAPEEMQRFRYIAVLRGNDVGSSFYWTMKAAVSGSCRTRLMRPLPRGISARGSTIFPLPRMAATCPPSWTGPSRIRRNAAPWSDGLRRSARCWIAPICGPRCWVA